MNRHEHRGSCHFGNLRWTLRSEISLAQLPVQTCGCRFCRKHGLLTTSDPQGEMDFILPHHTAVPLDLFQQVRPAGVADRLWSVEELIRGDSDERRRAVGWARVSWRVMVHRSGALPRP